MTKISTPHDAFFKEVLTNKEKSTQFLQQYLPKEIQARVEFSTLAICKESYIHPHLRMLMSAI